MRYTVTLHDHFNGIIFYCVRSQCFFKLTSRAGGTCTDVDVRYI